MFSFKVIIFLAACLQWSYCKLDKYCSLCNDHTMCIYSGLGQSCGRPGDWGISEKDKKEIVDFHNWVRRIVASGREPRGVQGGQPKAANMRELVWDDDLSEVAQRWADQCLFKHDSCRNDPRWYVGQNIYWKYTNQPQPVNWTDTLLSWFSEVSQIHPQEIRAFSFKPGTAHYTQMVWHNTYALGCGRRDYGLERLYVCNYGPSGNWLGEPIYAIGEPCSECPQETICNEFLCASPSQKSEREVQEVRGQPITAAPGGKRQEKLKPPKENQTQRNQTDAKLQQHKKEGTQKPETSKSEKSGKEGEDSSKGKTKVCSDDYEIVLDEKTRKAIEKVHEEIEKLLKMFIKNIRNFRKDERS